MTGKTPREWLQLATEGRLEGVDAGHLGSDPQHLVLRDVQTDELGFARYLTAPVGQADAALARVGALQACLRELVHPRLPELRGVIRHRGRTGCICG